MYDFGQLIRMTKPSHTRRCEYSFLLINNDTNRYNLFLSVHAYVRVFVVWM